MRVEIRMDSVLIDGYVNAVERESRAIDTAQGRVNEKIAAGTFGKALERAENVQMLLDHDKSVVLGDTKSGNLQLSEDNIGLRAIATITNPDVMSKAKKGLLKGWSFGMLVNKDEVEERADKLPLRTISDLDLFEVSLIDERMTPAYIGTSVETRADEKVNVEHRGIEAQVVVEEFKKPIDYSKLEDRLKNLQK